MIILYGSVARNEYTDESDIDIAIILKNEIDNKTKEQFINWSADMDIRYDRVFSIIDIKESNIQKWGDSLPFYRGTSKFTRIVRSKSSGFISTTYAVGQIPALLIKTSILVAL